MLLFKILAKREGAHWKEGIYSRRVLIKLALQEEKKDNSH